MERDKSTSGKPKESVTETALPSNSETPTTTKKPRSRKATAKTPTSIQDQITAIEATRTPKQVSPSGNIDDVLKQYNLQGLDISTTPKSKYGTSNDAILASILKQQGIVPSTPRALEVCHSKLLRFDY